MRFVQKLFIFTLVLASTPLLLSAADSWQTKSFTQWNDKDIDKLVADSPWARPYNVIISHDSMAPSNGRNTGARPAGGAAPSEADEHVPTVARWSSALPMRQVMARLKYKDDAGTSPDAKALLDAQQTSYIIEISGAISKLLHGDTEKAQAAAAKAASLSVKGKAPLKPENVKIDVTGGDVLIMFSFPRSAAFSAEDKEIEFQTKVGDESLHYKFRPKDMVFNGKLEL